MLALGLLLLGQSLLAGFGPDFVELLEILPDLDFGLFLTQNSFSGQVDFTLVLGAQLWPFWAQIDLYPLLLNLVIVVGCCRGSGRRVRHLLSQAIRMYNFSVLSLIMNWLCYDAVGVA